MVYNVFVALIVQYYENRFYVQKNNFLESFIPDDLHQLIIVRLPDRL